MKRVSVWMASAAASLLAAPAMAADDVESQLAQMQELVKGLQQKVDAQEEQIQHQSQLLQDAQRVMRADELESKSGLAAFLDSIDVTGAVIGSYNFNINTPTNGDGGSRQNTGTGATLDDGDSGPFLPYHPDANTFQVDQAWFGLGKPATQESRGGFQFDIFFGETAVNFGSGDSGHSGDSTSAYVVDQAYVEYLAPVADINLKLGKFDTVVGAEDNRQWRNFNITHGIVDTMLQPVNHVGLLGTVPIGDMAQLGAGVVNSAGSSISASDDSEEKSYIATMKLGDNRANIRGSFLYGAEPSIVSNFQGAAVHQTGDKVGLADVVAWFNPTDNISLWANYDYLYVEGTGYHANGVALAGRAEVLPDFGISARGEYIRESPSQSHGTLLIQETGPETSDIWSVTGTLDYALTEHLMVKSELRWDKATNGSTNGSGNHVFSDNNPDRENSNDQLLWLVAAQYVF